VVSLQKPTVLILERCQDHLNELLQLVTKAGLEGLAFTDGHDLNNHHSWPNAVGVLFGSLDARQDPAVVLAKLRQASIPVIVVTDAVSENAAFRTCTTREAISQGIEACLPRRNLATDLERTLRSVVQTSPADTSARGIQAICYTIDNIPEVLPMIVSHIRTQLEACPFSDPMDSVRMTVALSEVLDNALYHGNLELSSDLRQGDGRAWREESQRRLHQAPYCDRQIRIEFAIDNQSARFLVRDEGPGFNPHNLSDCTDEENLERCSGRGLLLIRMYMDEVRFNETGNEAILVKHHSGHRDDT
jgi:anti-sigma regulatory factor (Ser/Thr protein kinase)